MQKELKFGEVAEKTLIELTRAEWLTVTAALLCLQDHDANQGNMAGSFDACNVRKKIWGGLTQKG